MKPIIAYKMFEKTRCGDKKLEQENTAWAGYYMYTPDNSVLHPSDLSFPVKILRQPARYP
jgi:hypothetical protein